MMTHSPNARRVAALAAACGAVAIGTLLVARVRAAGVPAAGALVYTGVLETPDGVPVDGDKPIAIAVYDAETKGNKIVGCETASDPLTPVVHGRFQVQLPDACLPAVHTTPDLWIQIDVEGLSLGRTKLTAVPYALEAGHAAVASAASDELDAALTDLKSRMTSVEGYAVGACTTVAGACGAGTFNQPTYFLDRVAGTCPADHPVFKGFAFKRCGTLGTADEGLSLSMTCCALQHPAAK